MIKLITSVVAAMISTFSYATNDPHYSEQAQFSDPIASIDLALSKQLVPYKTKVAVLSSGIAPHEDIRNYYLGKNFTDLGESTDYSNTGIGCSGFGGTEISGVIKAEKNNAIGIAGINPDAQLLSAKISYADCQGETPLVISSQTALVDAISWAIQQDAKIIYIGELTESLCTTDVQEVINEAAVSNRIVITHAGGSNQNISSMLPANCENVLVVGAYGNDGNYLAEGGKGSQVDFSTIGEVFTTLSNGEYGVVSSSAMAGAVVTSMLSHFSGAFPSATYQELIDSLDISSTTFDDKCIGCGSGMLNYSNYMDYLVRNFGSTIEFSHLIKSNEDDFCYEQSLIKSLVDAIGKEAFCNTAKVNLSTKYNPVDIHMNYNVARRPIGSSSWDDEHVEYLENLTFNMESQSAELVVQEYLPDTYEYIIFSCDADGEHCTKPENGLFNDEAIRQAKPSLCF
jgi:hypothetical protein